MGIETSTTISGLNALWPLGTDPRAEGDNHLRLVKAVLQEGFDDASPGNFKFKRSTTLSFHVGAVLRAQIIFGIGASGTARISSYTSAGVSDSYLDHQPGGLTSRGDGATREVSLTNLAGTLYQMRLGWTNTGTLQILAYNTGGAVADYHTIGGQNSYASARVVWINDTKVAGDIRLDGWVGPDKRMLWLANANQDFYFIRSNASGSVAENLAIFSANGDVRAPVGALISETVSKGVMVAAAGGYGVLAGTSVDGSAIGTSPKNNVELATWWGFGIKDYTGVTRWAVDARTGVTRQEGDMYIGGAAIFRDGNMQFAGTMVQFGTYLSDALGNAARYNNQTAVGATGFPLGTVIAVYTNGLAISHNQTLNPCLSTADTLYYRLQGNASAGTRLDGTWRCCGHVGADWVMAQRTQS